MNRQKAFWQQFAIFFKKAPLTSCWPYAILRKKDYIGSMAMKKFFMLGTFFVLATGMVFSQEQSNQENTELYEPLENQRDGNAYSFNAGEDAVILGAPPIKIVERLVTETEYEGVILYKDPEGRFAIVSLDRRNQRARVAGSLQPLAAEAEAVQPQPQPQPQPQQEKKYGYHGLKFSGGLDFTNHSKPRGAGSIGYDFGKYFIGGIEAGLQPLHYSRIETEGPDTGKTVETGVFYTLSAHLKAGIMLPLRAGSFRIAPYATVGPSGNFVVFGRKAAIFGLSWRSGIEMAASDTARWSFGFEAGQFYPMYSILESNTGNAVKLAKKSFIASGFVKMRL